MPITNWNKGKSVIGGESFSTGGIGARVLSNTVATTDLTVKTLFTIPKGAVIDNVVIFQSTTGATTPTTATLSVGTTVGAPTEWLSAANVKTATGVGFQTVLVAAYGPIGGAYAAATPIYGLYAETGTPATSGGPWTVAVTFHIP